MSVFCFTILIGISVLRAACQIFNLSILLKTLPALTQEKSSVILYKQFSLHISSFKLSLSYISIFLIYFIYPVILLFGISNSVNITPKFSSYIQISIICAWNTNFFRLTVYTIRIFRDPVTVTCQLFDTRFLSV